jgi:hypothetical protein
MAQAPQEYDQQTTAKLKKLAQKRGNLESKLQELDESDQEASESIQTKLEALDDEEEALTKDAPIHYAEAIKAVGTAFLLLDPDGRVRREYRILSSRPLTPGSGDGQDRDGSAEPAQPPTPDDLRDGQLATTFTHQALAVREALLKNSAARKRVLALILHEKVRSEALAVGHEANGSTVHANNDQGFTSTALEQLRQRRADLDPLHNAPYIEDGAAYDAMKGLSEKKLDSLIGLLTVECVTAHLQRRTQLVWQLALELGVNVRRYWRPDERWLCGFQKIQLAQLLGELRGPLYATDAPTKKKSELVGELAKLFTDAANGCLEDAAMATKLNDWLPSNLREAPPAPAGERASAA